MAEDPTPEQPTDWNAIGKQLAMGLLTEGVPGMAKAFATADLEKHGSLTALSFNLAEDVATKAGETLHKLEEPFLPIIAAFVAPILAGLFGAEISEGDLRRRFAPGAGNRGAVSIVDGFMRAVIGDTPAVIEPSDVGAKRVAAAAVQASLESTFNALVPELLSDLLPFDLGHFKELTELPESIIRTLGVSRLVRRALQPAITVACTTPATWYYNKLHRPTLLGASTLAKQITRNPAQREAWLEDLRREGYSEDRIEALLNEQAKFHSVTDLALLIRTNQWSTDEAVKHLVDQGYSDDVARVELLIEKIKIIAAFERSIASDAVTAFGNGNIDEGTLGGMVTGATISPQEKAQYVEHAHAKRILNQKALTPGEAKDAVKAGVLTFVDYRRALERDGRDDGAVIVLELLLRAELDAKKAIEQHRKELDAERAAEKRQRAADALAKKAAADAKLAIAARGKAADLEAAFVRGLIPVERVREVYDATYDGDTADVLTALVEARRADYVAQQAAAEAARQRAATRGANVGELETAVMTGVLTLDQFRRRLEDLDFTPDDAGLLTATLAARMQARDDAEQKRDAAAAAAKVRHVDLSTVELLVRRGHRSLDDYGALLASLGFDAGAIAAMRERLQILINDDAAAAKVRADAAAKLRNRGLSLDQVRRAVLLGVTPIGDYSTWLLGQGFGADAVRVLVAELQIDLDEAEAARRRRADAERRTQAGSAPLSDVRRAARLGLIPLDAYLGRLAVAGYTDDDVAIESDLITTEIADDAARAAKAAAAEAAAPPKGLSLQQLASAVKVGTASVDDYYARAVAIGLSADDAGTLAATLQAELDATAAARRRKDELAAAGADRELGRGVLETAVRKGVITLDDYAARLPPLGYSADDAALLVAVLDADLAAKAATTPPA